MRLRNLTGAGLGGSAAIIKRLKGEKGEAKKWMEVKELVTALPPCDASVELNSWELELCGLSLFFYCVQLFLLLFLSFFFVFSSSSRLRIQQSARSFSSDLSCSFFLFQEKKKKMLNHVVEPPV
jgi:hypothetical protein